LLCQHLATPLKDAVEGERTIPRATFRRGQLSLQSNEIFGRTNPIPKLEPFVVSLNLSGVCTSRARRPLLTRALPG
jgi:hypothetical protein